MKYYVTLEDRTVEVDLSGAVPTVDGRPVETDLAEVPGTRVRHLLADGRSHALIAARGAEAGEWDIHFNGHRFGADVVDERTKAIREMTGGAAAHAGPKPVRAPMPGLVVRVEIGEGDEVGVGQGLVVVEAMKMENELKAESAAVVSRVHVGAGDAVEKGTILIEFEEDGSPQ